MSGAKATCFEISLMASLQWSRLHELHPLKSLKKSQQQVGFQVVSLAKNSQSGDHPDGWVSLWPGVLELRGGRCSLSSGCGGRWTAVLWWKNMWDPRTHLSATACDHKRGLAGSGVIPDCWSEIWIWIYLKWRTEQKNIVEYTWNRMIKFMSNVWEHF